MMRNAFANRMRTHSHNELAGARQVYAMIGNERVFAGLGTEQTLEIQQRIVISIDNA
jgi:hypothetical protein